jgi:hypothetical protein
VDARKRLVALGAVGNMMAQVTKLSRPIGTFNAQPQLPNIRPARRTEIKAEITNLVTMRGHLDTLHTGLRTLAGPLPVSHRGRCYGRRRGGYTQDWDLIQIDPNMLDLASFEGNKHHFGTSPPLLFCCPFCSPFCSVFFSYRLLRYCPPATPLLDLL